MKIAFQTGTQFVSIQPETVNNDMKLNWSIKRRFAIYFMLYINSLNTLMPG